LAREIQRAESSPPDQPFVFDLGELKDDSSFMSHFRELSTRKATPQEILEDANQIRSKHSVVAEEIKKYVPEAVLVQTEFEDLHQQYEQLIKLKQPYSVRSEDEKRLIELMKVVAGKASKIRYEVERRNKEESYEKATDIWGFPGNTFSIPYINIGRNEYSFDAGRAKATIGELVEFLKNPQPRFERLQKVEDDAKRALAGDTSWSAPYYTPGFKLERKQPVLAKVFLDVSRPMLNSIFEYEKIEPAMTERYNKLDAEEKQLDEQRNQLRVRIDDMVRQRQTGKGKMAAWLKSIIRKS